MPKVQSCQKSENTHFFKRISRNLPKRKNSKKFLHSPGMKEFLGILSYYLELFFEELLNHIAFYKYDMGNIEPDIRISTKTFFSFFFFF